MSSQSFIHSIPKAELHCHLEGTITPTQVRRFSKRNRIPIPDDLFLDDTHYNWHTFLEFLRTYDLACSVLKTPEDYSELTYDYLKSISQEGAIYAELIISPDHGKNIGLSYGDMLFGITQGLEKAHADFGIETRLLSAFVRHYGAQRAIPVAKLLETHPHKYVTGVNMAGDENQHHPKDFKRAFEIAHALGLGCTAHAGEAAGPQSIQAVLDYLPVTRIGHGVRAIEDPNLIHRLVSQDVTLEVCPGSNIALNIYQNYNQHPLNDLKKAGVPITLSSDDPSFFRTTLQKEYERALTVFHFTPKELIETTKRSLKAAFVDSSTKKKLLTFVSDWEKKHLSSTSSPKV